MTDKHDDEFEHRQRMQRYKELVASRVANATEERGTLIVITGDGKGKSTSGFGTITRAVGYGFKTAVAQFIKGKWPCGERDLLQKLGVPFEVMGTGFTWDTQNRALDIEAAERVWAGIKPALADPEVEVVLLDELTYMLTYEYLDLDEVVQTLLARPLNQSVVVTGRNCPQALLDVADTVSEVQAVKHAFEAGIKARKGVDW